MVSDPSRGGTGGLGTGWHQGGSQALLLLSSWMCQCASAGLQPPWAACCSSASLPRIFIPMCHKCCCDFDIWGVKLKHSPPPSSLPSFFSSLVAANFADCASAFPMMHLTEPTLKSTCRCCDQKRGRGKPGMTGAWRCRGDEALNGRPGESKSRFCDGLQFEVVGRRGRAWIRLRSRLSWWWSHFRCGTGAPPPLLPPPPLSFFTTISIVRAGPRTKTDCKSSSGSESLGCRWCVCSFSTVSDERDSFALWAGVNLYATLLWGVSHARRRSRRVRRGFCCCWGQTRQAFMSLAGSLRLLCRISSTCVTLDSTTGCSASHTHTHTPDRKLSFLLLAC